MKRVDFSTIPYSTALQQNENSPETTYTTADKIDLKQFYAHEGENKDKEFVSGIPPYLRGPYSSMYAIRPWTIRQYAGFSTAEESNAFYRRNLAFFSSDTFLQSCLRPMSH